MPRTPETIDADLAASVTTRTDAGHKIIQLLVAIDHHTCRIERLLNERTNAHNGRHTPSHL